MSDEYKSAVEQADVLLLEAREEAFAIFLKLSKVRDSAVLKLRGSSYLLDAMRMQVQAHAAIRDTIEAHLNTNNRRKAQP